MTTSSLESKGRLTLNSIDEVSCYLQQCQDSFEELGGCLAFSQNDKHPQTLSITVNATDPLSAIVREKLRNVSGQYLHSQSTTPLSSTRESISRSHDYVLIVKGTNKSGDLVTITISWRRASLNDDEIVLRQVPRISAVFQSRKGTADSSIES